MLFSKEQWKFIDFYSTLDVYIKFGDSLFYFYSFFVFVFVDAVADSLIRQLWDGDGGVKCKRE